MFKNYLKISLRNIVRHKMYAILNIFGLTIGLTCALIIFLFVYDELTFDMFHQKANRIYRLGCTYYLPNSAGSEHNATMGPVVGPRMVDDFPEILQCVRIQVNNNRIVQVPNSTDKFFETIHFADSNFFNLFSFPLSSGNLQTALVDPYTIVVSQSTALKYFNRIDVVGETLWLPEDSLSFKITGVLSKIPSNSHLQFDLIASMQTRYSQNVYMESWWNFGTYSYLELAENTDVIYLTDKAKFISREYIADQEDGSGYKQEYFFQPLNEIHLNSDLRYELSDNNKASTVYIILVIGILILLIASINFMNLATARSGMRAKEVGLRKVVGAYKHQLIGQFILESLLITFFSLILSLIATYFGISYINNFTDKQLSLNFLEQPVILIFLVIVTLLLGLLSGSYPAFFLSSLKPVQTLKGGYSSNALNKILRKILVISQFSISVILITTSLVVYKQLEYMVHKDLGFDKDRTVIIPTKFVNNADLFFQRLKDALVIYPEIKSTTLSSRVPGFEMSNNVVRLGWDDEASWSDMRYLAVDYDFINHYDLNIIHGRGFDEKFGTDPEQAFLINQSGMRRLGWSDPKEAVGQKIKWQSRLGYIIGVIEDFHFMSVNRAIEPFIMVMNGNRTPGYISIKIGGEHYENILDKIEQTFYQSVPYGVFDYFFLDEDFDKQYKADQKFMSVFTFFTIIAILVACLGLYGLAMFTTELRIKEIGIRKVLGASVFQVILLITTEFSRLVILAIIIGVPIAYWGLSTWLGYFPYKTNIGFIVFIISGLSSLLIAWATISFQSVKAATVNPVDTLAQE